jgi:hypothetical protein
MATHPGPSSTPAAPGSRAAHPAAMPHPPTPAPAVASSTPSSSAPTSPPASATDATPDPVMRDVLAVLLAARLHRRTAPPVPARLRHRPPTPRASS